MDRIKIINAVEMLLEGIGDLQISEDHYKETPKRVADMCFEIFEGLNKEPPSLKIFEEDVDQMIISDNIPFCSFCAHHLLPFRGFARIGYIPRNGKVVGISKLARVLDHFARRPTVQEIITNQVADYLFNYPDLRPLGVGVILKASHDCEIIRGIKKEGSIMVTSTLRGIFFEEPEVRKEFMGV
jgi:GTP cyclohydrolase I